MEVFCSFLFQALRDLILSSYETRVYLLWTVKEHAGLDESGMTNMDRFPRLVYTQEDEGIAREYILSFRMLLKFQYQKSSECVEVDVSVVVRGSKPMLVIGTEFSVQST